MRNNTTRKFPILETERLVLRELRIEDVDALFGILSDDEVLKYYGLRPFRKIERAERLLKRHINKFRFKSGIRWGVTLKGDDTLIGSCGYKSWDRKNFKGEIVYELVRSHWNQGIMTEAVRAVVAYGFEAMCLNRTEAWVMTENHASRRLLIKAGFKSEGVSREHIYWMGALRDIEWFSLLRQEYEQMKDSDEPEQRPRFP